MNHVNTEFKNLRVVKIVILFLVSLFVITLSACDSKLDYDDFKKDHFVGMDNIVEQNGSSYLVYYYGIDCSYCKEIKQDILEFALKNDADLKVYFLVSAADTNDQIINDPSYITDPITGTPMSGTPTMITVNNRRVVDLSIGPSVILDLLDQINEGSYGLIN